MSLATLLVIWVIGLILCTIGDPLTKEPDSGEVYWDIGEAVSTAGGYIVCTFVPIAGWLVMLGLILISILKMAGFGVEEKHVKTPQEREIEKMEYTRGLNAELAQGLKQVKKDIDKFYK